MASELVKETNRKMEEELLSLVTGLKSDRRLGSFDEAATKQVVILRVLSLLGWDTYNIDEVEPEHLVEDTRVDYLLKHANKAMVFIEAKRVAEPLERHQQQLLGYSFKEGVPLAVLTNGLTWWFYLPLLKGKWEQRKFYSIDVSDQPSEEIVVRLVDYLSKTNVASGKALENAEAVYKTRQKEYEISETLPRAWLKMVAEPDSGLADLIAGTTEKMCGFRPDNLVVKNFISSFLPAGTDDFPRPTARLPVPTKRGGETPLKSKKTLENVLKNAAPPLKNVFLELRQAIIGLGDNVLEVPGANYIDYRKSSTFVSIYPKTKRNRLLIFIKMGDKQLADPKTWTSPVPDSYSFGKLNTQFEVGESNQLGYAIQLIKQAYDFVP